MTPNETDPRQLIATMGWEPLPYGCAGLIRHRSIAEGKVIWSWLIIVPWAVNDSKPWIDGTKLYDLTLKTEEQQRREIEQEMRDILDQRYGASVAERSVDQFLRSIQDEA
jgi:hypothetical protein